MSIKETMAMNPTMAKINYAFYKSKPTICVVLGAVGTGVSVYLAWKAGRKTDDTIAEITEEINEVKAKRPKEVVDAPTGKVTYIVEDGQLEKSEYNKALIKVNCTAAFKLGCLFAPAVLTEVASVMTIGYGYGMLNERYVETAKAAAYVWNALSSYRGRVREVVGEDKERQLYYGLKEEIVEEPEVDKNGEVKLDKSGKPKMHKTKREILEGELAKHSPFARVFDAEHTQQFETDADGNENISYNGKFVKDSQLMFNNVLRYSKYHIVTANDIYSHFGLPLSSDGAVNGWHVRIDKNGQLVFDVGDSEGIKIMLFPVWFRETDTSVLKRTYIMDLNVGGNVLKYYDE